MNLKKSGGHRLPTGLLGGALASNETAIVAACMDGVYLLPLDGGERRKLYAHASYASAAHWLSSEEVVSAGYDGTIRWYKPASDQQVRELKLHDFWSWDSAISPDGRLLASVTGQYLAAGYRYEPAAEREPSLCLVATDSGEVVHRLPHVPSVQSVAFSPDSKRVAAGNLMGEVRVFDVASGEMLSQFTTDAFTSWGIIKSHCYLGGIFSMRFTPDGDALILAGMGPMRDPMAGNGKQLWQKWAWQSDKPELVDQTHQGENGEGLMEALAVHPTGEHFAMGGRLRGGDWNVATFAMESGDRLATLKTGFRVTELLYSADGSKLYVLGAQGQPQKKQDGKFPDFGRIDIYDVATQAS